MNDTVGRVVERKGNHVEATSVNTTVLAAVERMNEQRIGSLVVLDNEQPIGILTERDVLLRVVARGRDASTTLVRDVMTANLITISRDVTIAEALRVITTRRCRHLPVIGERGLCGLISIGDLTKWIVQDQQRTIDDLNDYIRAA